MKRQFRWLEISARCRDIRVVEKLLDGVKVSSALQQPTAGFASQVVHVEVHLPQLPTAAGQELAVRAPVLPMPTGAEPERRPCLLIVLQSLSDLVAED